MLETYRDVTAESRVQRKYHALLARERGAKEDLERKVLERTEALRRAQDQLVLNEKMSSLGRLVAGIAHELNNPINFVYGNVDFLAQYFRHLINLIAIYESGELPEETRRRAAELKDSIDFEFLMEDWERLLAQRARGRRADGADRRRAQGVLAAAGGQGRGDRSDRRPRDDAAPVAAAAARPRDGAPRSTRRFRACAAAAGRCSRSS